MFRVLNVRLQPTVRTIPTAAPDVHVMELYGRHVAFDANSLCAVETDADVAGRLKALAERFRQGRDGDAGPLEQYRGLLFSRQKPQFPLLRPAAVRRVVLNVTHECNLACRYCFVRNACDRPDSPAVMSPDTAMQALRLFAPGAAIDVGFFGGEPLLAWKVVRAVILESEAQARTRRVPVRFHITTNGLLLDDAKVAFLSKRRCSLLVSLDGPEDLHNASRPARSRRINSFERTMKALERIRGTALASRTMARATFTPDRPEIRRRLEFLGGLLDRGLIRGFSVEPAVLTEGCAAREPAFGPPAASKGPDLADEYHSAAEWFIGRVRSGRSPGFFHFCKLLGRIAYASHAGAECGAGFGYVTVAPDGSLHACHREGGTRIGDLKAGFDEEARAAWCDNRLYLRNGCSACWARYLCGGGCRQAALEIGGRLDVSPPERCRFMRTMLAECLWMMTQLTRDELSRAIPNDRAK